MISQRATSTSQSLIVQRARKSKVNQQKTHNPVSVNFYFQTNRSFAFLEVLLIQCNRVVPISRIKLTQNGLEEHIILFFAILLFSVLRP